MKKHVLGPFSQIRSHYKLVCDDSTCYFLLPGVREAQEFRASNGKGKKGQEEEQIDERHNGCHRDAGM